VYYCGNVLTDLRRLLSLEFFLVSSAADLQMQLSFF